jgi:predicted helicase
LNFIYAILHSATYRDRYRQNLARAFPAVPRSASRPLFQDLAVRGGDLVALHLLESPRPEKPITTYTGPAAPDVEKVSYANGTGWLDRKQTYGFAGVPGAVWNFHIGGYQVCQKWLKDRKGRTLSKDDIAHYQKIVVAVSETIRLMKEIDETIEKHGGWPGAFVTDPAKLEELKRPKT